MPEFPPEQVTPFVFSDPSGKRWPRLRLILLIGGVLFFVALVLFVQTLFVIPKMNVPFSHAIGLSTAAAKKVRSSLV